MEHQLLELLEYRNVLGALTTSIDGLLVASVAVNTPDAELIAAATAGHAEQPYYVAASGFGELHIARGNELRLIVLAETGTNAARLREIMDRHLAILEESLRV
jgi:hypothetical protein